MTNPVLPTRQPWTVDEFLNWEDQQPERWELTERGLWRMMVGAPLGHSLLVGNLFASLHRQLRGTTCDVHRETFKLVMDKAVYYPDILVRCGPRDLDSKWTEAPRLLAEVLSPSTEDRDIGEKKRAFLTIPGLEAYLIVSQRPQWIELWLPANRFLSSQEARGPGDTLRIAAMDLVLTWDEVFEGVERPG